MRLLVTGTRHGRPDVAQALAAYVARWPDPWFVLGGDLNRGRHSQRGVDLQAGQWARAHGYHGVVEYALWDTQPGAGPKRNARMVRWGRPGDHILAFPDDQSRGTWNCFSQARAKKILGVVVQPGWLEELAALHQEFWG